MSQSYYEGVLAAAKGVPMNPPTNPADRAAYITGFKSRSN